MSSEKLLLESTTMSWYPPDIDEEETELILSLNYAKMSSEKLLLESTNMSWYPPDLDEEDLERIFSLPEDAHYYKMYLIFAGFSVYLYICEPIVLLVMLGRSSKDFRMAELKCCRKNMRNYGDDDLESNSGSEPAENNVTFHRSSENIRL
ncbi:hypothetical protein D910_02337 [Dendroctonus ponderosae]|uniref:Uncharacterized protein n=1 Tax=Dendroctonus ponderosae TaxID=77166 RepID=U4TTR0_DENPD|nr:hypothetical protein D910_02337 [Dendroctonus ponderosae]